MCHNYCKARRVATRCPQWYSGGWGHLEARFSYHTCSHYETGIGFHSTRESKSQWQHAHSTWLLCRGSPVQVSYLPCLAFSLQIYNGFQCPFVAVFPLFFRHTVWNGIHTSEFFFSPFSNLWNIGLPIYLLIATHSLFSSITPSWYGAFH